MKAHTTEFKDEVKLFNREIDSIITYELNSDTIELGNEELNSITPHYETAILKSAMRQLDIDSNVDIPLNTIINLQFGVKVRDDDVEDYRDNYDYINFGNYIVYSSEKQEDKKSYKIICYDKMLYSMVDYVGLEITYPITIRDYINAICEYLGLTFKNANSTFANYNREIQNELYLDSGGNSLNYKFRDVLDELAQATASTICINEDDDELEVRYITDTNDTIDEEYLKDINVNFGEKYGPINSIVLSRSAETDNVYLKDDQSIEQNGLCEIKIIDNQIMNWNDRSDYLPDILSQLGGLEYYLNDYTSTGIAYYNLCDRYTVKIDETYYSCVMFNDEVEITQGLKEIVSTEKPKENQTDYSKADKTDRKINQTYFIVDKQNQKIESVISNVSEQDSKISQITQTVDDLTSQISDISDITTSGETYEATFNITGINDSEPIMLKIRPINANISYLYPRDNLYPSDTLYMTDRIIRFHNNTENEDIDYILPDDLLYYDNTHYDEFYLDYESQTCQVIKRCKYNADGTVGLLSNERIDDYSTNYPEIHLTTGDYTISLLGYATGYVFARLMATNIYTTQFYTKAETNSKINQKANEINVGVNQMLSNYSTTTQMNSAITLKANEINSTVAETYATKTTTNQLSSRITQNSNSITSEITNRQNGDNSLSSRISQTAKSIALSVNNGSTSSGITITTTKEDGTTSTATGNILMNGLVSFTNLSTSGQTNINGANIVTGIIKSANYVANTSGTSINLTNGVIDSKNFKLASNGDATFKGLINGGSISVVGNYSDDDAYIEVKSPNSTNVYPIFTRIWNNGMSAIDYSQNYPDARVRAETIGEWSELNNGDVNAFRFNNISLEEKKKNFEKLENALEIIKNTDIYKFNYKREKDNVKKHIGLIIGENRNYSKELTNDKNDAVDLYSMGGVCLQAIKEQQIEIEELKKEIEKLKEDK